jgi:hypothetical protein
MEKRLRRSFWNHCGVGHLMYLLSGLSQTRWGRIAEREDCAGTKVELAQWNARKLTTTYLSGRVQMRLY